MTSAKNTAIYFSKDHCYPMVPNVHINDTHTQTSQYVMIIGFFLVYILYIYTYTYIYIYDRLKALGTTAPKLLNLLDKVVVMKILVMKLHVFMKRW